MFRRFTQSILFTLLSFLLFTSGNAQITYHISNYPVSFLQGGNQNWDLGQDSKQRLFVGNNTGLVVLENTSASIFYLPEQTIIRSVLVIDSKIFTGSFEEFGFWEEQTNGVFSYTSLSALLPNRIQANDEIWKIAEHAEKVYFHSFGSIYVYDYKEVKRLSENFNGFMFLYPAGKELLTQKIGGSFYFVKNDSLIELPSELIKSNETLKGASLMNTETLIAGTSNGLYSIDLKTKNIKTWEAEKSIEVISNEINGIAKVGEYIAVGTILNGIYLYTTNGKLLTIINTTSRLQNNTVLSMLPDSLGNLWVGMDKGLDYIAFDSPVDSYRSKEESIGSVYAAALYKNRLYVGSNQGIYRYERGETGKFSSPSLIDGSQGQVWFLSVIDERLYCGLNSGTYVFDQEKLKQVSSIPGAYTLKDYPGKPDKKIQSTYNEIVIYEQNEQSTFWEMSHTINPFAMPSRFLEIDHQGSIWLGHTIKGIYQLQPSIDFKSVSRLTKIGVEQGLTRTTNRLFKADNRIIVSAGDSLFQWDSIHQQFEDYSLLKSIFSEGGEVFNIVDAGNNRYWIVKKDEILLAEIHFNSVKLLYRMLPQQYDLHLVESYERIIPLSDQLHLLCLDDGFAVIDLNLISRMEIVFPDLAITKIKRFRGLALQEVLQTNSNRKFSFSDDATTIGFSWKTSLPVGAYRFFQFRLSGYDNKWSNWSPQTEKKYERLNPGDYTFQVRTLNAAGLTSAPVSISFTVKSPWYINTYGFILYAIIFVLIFLFVRLYLAKRRWNKIERKMAIEKEKISIEKELAEKELIAVRNEKLQAEIEHKSSQLATNTMSIVRKNELLQSIKLEMESQKAELGERFPKKYYQRVMNLIDKNLRDEHEWEAFEQLYDQAHGDFFKRLKQEFPDLTASDLRLCAYLRMNLATKEIAPLLNISIRGVEERRYRLRKRLNLSSDMNLNEMIMTY